MGLREDFRNALGSIAAAVPDATHTMRHGENENGAVVQSSSRNFAEPVSDTAPAEAASFIANAADFPTLDEGAAVELDGSLRAVVSMKTDAVGATVTVGLSAEFEKCPAAYKGTRREAGHVRQIKHPLDILLLENGTADNFADALAPTYATAYTVAIRRDDWPEVTAPDPSDTIEVAPGGHPLTLKVSTVTRHDGWYILKCRTRG
ncbi:MAG: hypothetical protein II840_10375 [Kiritimatiellae bacterium]|nr:hypothetical protein [Kiritimatiellia bacterium]